MAALFFYAGDEGPGLDLFQGASVLPALLGLLMLYNTIHSLFAARAGDHDHYRNRFPAPRRAGGDPDPPARSVEALLPASQRRLRSGDDPARPQRQDPAALDISLPGEPSGLRTNGDPGRRDPDALGNDHDSTARRAHGRRARAFRLLASGGLGKGGAGRGLHAPL